MPAPWKLKAEFGKSGFMGTVHGPTRPGEKRTSPADIDEDHDFRNFKRIRLIARHQRHRRHVFGQSAQKQDWITFSALQSQQSFGAAGYTTIRNSDEAINVKESKDIRVDPATIVKKDLITARMSGLRSSFITSVSPRAATVLRPPARENPKTTGDLRAKVRPQLEVRRLSYYGSSPHVAYDNHHLQTANDWYLFDGVLSPSLFLKLTSRRIQSQSGKDWLDFHYLFACVQTELENQKWDQWKAMRRSPLWPQFPYSMTLVLVLFEDCTAEVLDCNNIATFEALHGTRVLVGSSANVFYGSSIGRWLFDWAFEFERKERASGRESHWTLRFAYVLWETIFRLERYSHHWRSHQLTAAPSFLHENGGHDGIHPGSDFSSTVSTWHEDMFNKAHFFVSYRCFLISFEKIFIYVIFHCGGCLDLGYYMWSKNAEFFDLLMSVWQDKRLLLDITMEELCSISRRYGDAAFGRR
ncbi:hypothetical protein BDV96DRAFT_653226 [Lophiotrema nucula]|uniref:Uncharacterized protein n=1 Tax=Lophiotrema nucula TaxID=690887 RepID=A0A6A5YL79_9PLEO|nr:hypothetical protein BDV96DRAFT_653226 [Lophiotrema nucula]